MLDIPRRYFSFTHCVFSRKVFELSQRVKYR